MRIRLTGSFRHLADEAGRGQIKQAAFALGFAVARRGHTVLIGTDDLVSIDPYVASGALVFAQEHRGSNVGIEVHRVEGRQVKFEPESLDRKIERRYYPAPIGGGNGRLAQLVGSVGACDVVIGLGGAKGTTLILDLARSMAKPRVCAAAFGGAAAEHFRAQQDFFRSHPLVRGAYNCLHERWSQTSAVKIVDIAEQLVSQHSYFISYSHEDASAADLIELLLRREGRTVHRDDTYMHPGDALSERIQGLLAQTTTFVTVWSRNSSDSAWCSRERDYAVALKNSPAMVFILLDDTALPRRERNNLALTALTREQLCVAVGTMLAGEGRRLADLHDNYASEAATMSATTGFSE